MRIWLLSILCCLGLVGPAWADSFAIQAGHVIVDAGKPPLGPSTVIVVDGRIKRIEPGAVAPEGARVIDLRSMTVLPGLIDVHVHLTMTFGESRATRMDRDHSEAFATAVGLHNALITARAGFTSVRDLGGRPFASLAVRNAIDRGLFPGPRMQVAGTALSTLGGHGDATLGLDPEIRTVLDQHRPQLGICTGAQQCAEAVHRIAALGVDVIKMHATGGVGDPGATGLEQHFTDEEMAAIVDTAHRLHLKVAAHAHGARGILAAVRAGVDSIEHGTFADATGLAEMKRRGTFLSPTLMAFEGLVRSKDDPNLYTAASRAKAELALAAWGKALAEARRQGVRIAVGTDASVYPHGENARELTLMVQKSGLSPRDALVAATTGGAELMGLLNETGTLEAGKSADLIAVAGDPLSNIELLQHVSFAMVRGQIVPMK